VDNFPHTKLFLLTALAILAYCMGKGGHMPSTRQTWCWNLEIDSKQVWASLFPSHEDIGNRAI